MSTKGRYLVYIQLNSKQQHERKEWEGEPLAGAAAGESRQEGVGSGHRRRLTGRYWAHPLWLALLLSLLLLIFLSFRSQDHAVADWQLSESCSIYSICSQETNL